MYALAGFFMLKLFWQLDAISLTPVNQGASIFVAFCPAHLAERWWLFSNRYVRFLPCIPLYL